MTSGAILGRAGSTGGRTSRSGIASIIVGVLSIVLALVEPTLALISGLRGPLHAATTDAEDQDGRGRAAAPMFGDDIRSAPPENVAQNQRREPVWVSLTRGTDRANPRRR